MAKKLVIYQIEEEPALGCGGLIVLTIIAHFALRYLFGFSLLGTIWNSMRSIVSSIF